MVLEQYQTNFHAQTGERMNTVNKSLQERKPPGGPKDVLNWHSLYDDDRDDYVALLMQDALYVHEAACMLYPKSPEKYRETSQEDEGLMDSLVRLIEDSILTGDLPTIKTTPDKLVSSVELLEWAKRRGHIEERLAKWVRSIFVKKKRYTGRSIPALENDKDILGAGVAILAKELGEFIDKRVMATKLRGQIERTSSVFWPNSQSERNGSAYLPVETETAEKLLSSYMTKLRKAIDNDFDYNHLYWKSRNQT